MCLIKIVVNMFRYICWVVQVPCMGVTHVQDEVAKMSIRSLAQLEK